MAAWSALSPSQLCQYLGEGVGLHVDGLLRLYRRRLTAFGSAASCSAATTGLSMLQLVTAFGSVASCSAKATTTGLSMLQLAAAVRIGLASLEQHLVNLSYDSFHVRFELIAMGISVLDFYPPTQQLGLSLDLGSHYGYARRRRCWTVT